MDLLAHSSNELGQRHSLAKHLLKTAELAQEFASPFGAGDLAYRAGLLHDLGKADPEFQAYLEKCEAEPRKKHRGPGHKLLGAFEAAQFSPLLAFAIQGHHGGLPTRSELMAALDNPNFTKAVMDPLEKLKAEFPQISALSGKSLPYPPYLNTEMKTEFFIRMLYSTLVDADFLDTESHFEPQSSAVRDAKPVLEELWRSFETYHQAIFASKDGHLNAIRAEIYDACLNASQLPPGLFRLTVPTGGGKTFSGLAFALRHALAHNLNRVIFAVPFTSIIEQTARAYRKALPMDGAVLEHHSGVSHGDEELNEGTGVSWSRLASQNWAAPLVVTTTVQLFESLFSSRPSKCRKLHNVSGGVIVLDEVQSLPARLLTPILDAIRQLVDHYNTTIVLCTATQPEYGKASELGKMEDAREIVPNPGRYFQQLKRTTYHWPAKTEKWTWADVADEMRRGESRQALAVVNTKKDALALFAHMDSPETWHLSTLLCGAHRRDVLDLVRKKLAEKEPCYLVTTQVIEAGVDIDFPKVLRAVAPLDSIIQAAGRCNREGRLETGDVIIFDPAEGGMPKGYKTATGATFSLLNREDFDPHNPAIFPAYFNLLHGVMETGAKEIQEARREFNFPKVDELFRMIEDDTFPVIVRYRGFSDSDDTVDKLIAELEISGPGSARTIMRKLQPYAVNIYGNKLMEYRHGGLTREVVEGVYEWIGTYDLKKGIVETGIDPDRLVC